MTTRNTVVFVLMSVSFVYAGCAKPFSPPGGEQDRTPPRLVSAVPAALSVTTDLDAPIVLTFDETLSERGVNEAAVSISPRPRGGVSVDRKGERIEISTEGGWAPNQVYRVVLQPGVSDRFRNERKEPVEIVFSTGPPIQNTALAGLIMDRLTGRARATDGAVEAIRRGDSAVYTVVGDTAGFFALRNLPAGVYDVRAFGDANKNRQPDAAEAASPFQQIVLGATDTVGAVFVVLPMDTTPPRLVRAEHTDSLHITLTFEDFIDPDSGMVARTVSLVRDADSAPHPGTLFTQLKNIFQRAQPAPAAAAARDTVPQDSAAAARDSARAAAGVRRGGVAAAPRDTVSLPDRDVILTLSTPLQPATRYRIDATGFRNVNGLMGGGTVEFDSRPAPPARPAGQTPGQAAPAPDTTRALPLSRRGAPH